MFERYTERARHVVVLAQDEARALKHNYIGTEHLLLGLISEEEGLAARVLDSLDITLEEVRKQIARIVGQGDEDPTSGVLIPFTPRCKKVLELALREAMSLGHSYIGTEHVLLGLIRENEGVAARILLDFDATPEVVRNEVIRLLSGNGLQSGVRRMEADLTKVRTAKEAALVNQEFDKAAKLRDDERKLVQKLRDLSEQLDELTGEVDEVSSPPEPDEEPTEEWIAKLVEMHDAGKLANFSIVNINYEGGDDVDVQTSQFTVEISNLHVQDFSTILTTVQRELNTIFRDANVLQVNNEMAPGENA